MSGGGAGSLFLEMIMPWRTRRLLVILVLGLAVAHLAGSAHAAVQARPVLIGVLNASWGPTPQVVGLRDGLLELGYRENADFVIGVRFTQGDRSVLPDAARQLVQDGVNIIFADHDDAAKAAQQATTHVPIVFPGGRSCRTRTDPQLRSPRWQYHRGG